MMQANHFGCTEEPVTKQDFALSRDVCVWRLSELLSEFLPTKQAPQELIGVWSGFSGRGNLLIASALL